MIKPPQPKVSQWVDRWETTKQRLVANDFDEISEDELIAIMVEATFNLINDGYRRLDNQWILLSEVN